MPNRGLHGAPGKLPQYPEHFSVFTEDLRIVTPGKTMNRSGIEANQGYRHYSYIQSHALGNAGEVDLWLRHGTYAFFLLAMSHPSFGQLGFYVDDEFQVTANLNAGGGLTSVVATGTMYAHYDGLHTIRMQTISAGSGGPDVTHTKFWGRRTGGLPH